MKQRLFGDVQFCLFLWLQAEVSTKTHAIQLVCVYFFANPTSVPAQNDKWEIGPILLNYTITFHPTPGSFKFK